MTNFPAFRRTRRALLAWPLAWAIAGALGPAGQAAGADDGDALVIINGKPLPRFRVVDVLMETHGLPIMQQLVALELAKQETKRLKLEVTPAEVDAQYRHALAEIAPGSDAAGVPLNADQQQQALEVYLQQRCLTMPEFMIAMERNAHLRRVVEADFKIEEATLREEFARTYGEKVEIRHIQIESNDVPRLHRTQDLLSRGRDFADVARELSTNPATAQNGGLMPPFTFVDEQIPAALREIAFSLKPGERSAPILTGSFFHIVQLERRIPPEQARFEEVRDKVEESVRKRVLRQRMNELMTRLFKEANIRVLDRELRKGFEELLKEAQEGG